MAIHPSAIIEKDVQIDENVDIDAYSVIRRGVSIGSGTRIGTHVEIGPNTKIAKDNQIFKGAYLGGLPQDTAYEKVNSDLCLLEIGAENVFREYVTVHHGSKRITRIGHSNYFMAHSHIAHDCLVGDHVTLANYAGLGGWVEVADQVFISGHTLIHQHVRIGKLAMIGGLCRVIQDVPPFALIAQNNGQLYGYNRVGLKRAGWSDDQLNDIKKVFIALFRSGLGLKSIKLKLEEFIASSMYEVISKELGVLAHFFSETERGFLSRWEKYKH